MLYSSVVRRSATKRQLLSLCTNNHRTLVRRLLPLRRRWLSTTKPRIVEERLIQQPHNVTSTVYTLVVNKDEQQQEKWHKEERTKVQQKEESSGSNKPSTTVLPHNNVSTLLYDNVITHFLPANYPSSVVNGYGRFAALSFGASIAGSAAMVLSTQTLLLAVGIVGSNTTSASVMAGALNWVLKDGIGQLGGVWFASYMGRSISQFDSNPKYWRMVAAIVLDGATLLEMCAPLVPTTGGAVLMLASIANVGKNIGFLTASASRAALHQALMARDANNLGDITAKAGSQSMAASLCGTALGIGLSPVLGDVPLYWGFGFVGLCVIHQGCNYQALKAVPLSQMNRQRCEMVLEEYVMKDTVLTPSQVAAQESILWEDSSSQDWLHVGSNIEQVGGPELVAQLWQEQQEGDDGKRFLLVPDLTMKDKLHLIFGHNAQDVDLLNGMYQAYSVHHNDARDDNGFHAFLTQLKKEGWKTHQEVRVEPACAVRIRVQ